MKIKTSTILACFLLGILNLQAQYQSIFGSEQTEWNFLNVLCDAGQVDTFIHERDTAINGIEYHVVNEFGLLRESDENAKVWYRSFDEDDEVLFLDFTLDIGDTFNINSWDYFVDTVYQENNLKTIQFGTEIPSCGLNQYFEFREGVGPNFGFGAYGIGQDQDVKLIRCQTKDSVTINYLEEFGYDDDCQRSLVNTENIIIEDILVFPNPFHDVIALQFEDNSLRRVEIYNLSGTKLIEKKTSSDVINIATPKFDNGIYIVKVLRADCVQTYKISKF